MLLTWNITNMLSNSRLMYLFVSSYKFGLPNIIIRSIISLYKITLFDFV